MSVPLSPNTAKAVEKLFSDGEKEEVVRLLTEECAENIPNSRNEDEYDLENLRFQVLRLSEGNIEKLRDAVGMANEDWRDVICKAGPIKKYKSELLGKALERNAKSDAVWYHQAWNILGALAAFISMFVMQFSNASVFQSIVTVLSIAVVYEAGLELLNRLFGKARQDEKLVIMFLSPLGFVVFPSALGFFAAKVVQSFF